MRTGFLQPLLKKGSYLITKGLIIVVYSIVRNAPLYHVNVLLLVVMAAAAFIARFHQSAHHKENVTVTVQAVVMNDVSTILGWQEWTVDAMLCVSTCVVLQNRVPFRVRFNKGAVLFWGPKRGPGPTLENYPHVCSLSPAPELRVLEYLGKIYSHLKAEEEPQFVVLRCTCCWLQGSETH